MIAKIAIFMGVETQIEHAVFAALLIRRVLPDMLGVAVIDEPMKRVLGEKTDIDVLA